MSGAHDSVSAPQTQVLYAQRSLLDILLDAAPPEIADTAATASSTPPPTDTRRVATQHGGGESLQSFLHERSASKALSRWFGWPTDNVNQDLSRRLADHVAKSEHLTEAAAEAIDTNSRFRQLDLSLLLSRNSAEETKAVTRRLARDIATIDKLISDQVNAVLHHPRFQKLEASWRGIEFLTEQAGEGQGARIKLLDVSWKELTRDQERASDFDQSQLFRKVYSEEFGMPGGEPYGLLIGDYEVHPTPDKNYRHDDVSTLAGISQVAAASFAPFITGAHPSMLGLDDYSQLERGVNLERVFQQPQFIAWNNFRKNYEDSRFVGLTAPRVLWRIPYTDIGSDEHGERRIDGFRFTEQVAGPDRSRYLWGNASYAYASVVLRAYQESGWFADIRGVERGVEGGGLVAGLPTQSFSTDHSGVARKISTDVVITDDLEKSLSDFGFIPFCDCKDTEYSAFYSSGSVHKSKKYDRMAATVNAQMMSMMHYTLCVSRFAHYVKVLGRDKIGSTFDAAEIERYLNDWITRYVTPDTDAAPNVKAARPLRESQIAVVEIPGRPGTYECVVHLLPHYELDDMAAAVRIRSELIGASQ